LNRFDKNTLQTFLATTAVFIFSYLIIVNIGFCIKTPFQHCRKETNNVFLLLLSRKVCDEKNKTNRERQKQRN